MKELWIRIDKSVPNDAKDALLKTASQVCDAVLVDAKDMENARKTGAKIASGSSDSDINVLEIFDANTVSKLKGIGKIVAVRIIIRGKEDEEKAIKAADLSADYIIVDCPDWKIIPLENLIAKTRGRSKLLAEVSSAEDARLALETLELGADGVVLKTSDIDELMKTAAVTEKQALKV